MLLLAAAAVAVAAAVLLLAAAWLLLLAAALLLAADALGCWQLALAGAQHQSTSLCLFLFSLHEAPNSKVDAYIEGAFYCTVLCFPWTGLQIIKWTYLTMGHFTALFVVFPGGGSKS